MIHLFIIFFLCSICIGLIWSCVGLMDKIKRLEMEYDSLRSCFIDGAIKQNHALKSIIPIAEERIRDMKAKVEFEEQCG